MSSRTPRLRSMILINTNSGRRCTNLNTSSLCRVRQDLVPLGSREVEIARLTGYTPQHIEQCVPVPCRSTASSWRNSRPRPKETELRPTFSPIRKPPPLGRDSRISGNASSFLSPRPRKAGSTSQTKPRNCHRHLDLFPEPTRRSVAAWLHRPVDPDDRQSGQPDRRAVRQPNWNREVGADAPLKGVVTVLSFSNVLA
jgi:hypothetical protein